MTNEKKIKIGDLILNYNQLSVIKEKRNYQLAQKEFYLLYKLLVHLIQFFYKTRTNGRNMGIKKMNQI